MKLYMYNLKEKGKRLTLLSEVKDRESIHKEESVEDVEETILIPGIKYMSPESIKGEKCSTASDVYCLGSIMYELFSLKEPFDGQSMMEVGRLVAEEHKNPLSFKKQGKSDLFNKLRTATCSNVHTMKILEVLKHCWANKPIDRCAVIDMQSLLMEMLHCHELVLPKDVASLTRRDTGLKIKVKQPWEVRYDDLSIGEVVGTGTGATVYKGKWHGTVVAIKMLSVFTNDKSKSLIAENSEELNAFVKNFIEELSVTCDLRHPNVLTFYGACTQIEHMCMVLEYSPFGSVMDVLKNFKQEFLWPNAIKIAKGAATGLMYLHDGSVPVIHQNLKPQNLLLFQDYTTKIADFSLSGFYRKNKVQHGNGSENICYAAPELLLLEDPCTNSDVYSFGCVLYSLATRQVPYADMHLSDGDIIEKVTTKGLRPTIPEEIWPETYKALMLKCLSPYPANRPNFREIINDIVHIEKEIEEKFKGRLIIPSL